MPMKCKISSFIAWWLLFQRRKSEATNFIFMKLFV